MRPTAACLGLALGLATSNASATDDGQASAFKTICLDTGGDAAKVVATVRDSGWRDFGASPAGSAPGVRVFAKQAGPRRWQLLLQDSAYPADTNLPFPTHRKICAVILSPGDPDAIAGLRSAMGADPTKFDGSTRSWTYIERGASREYILPSGKADVQAAVEAAPLVTIFTGSTGEGTMMSFTRIVRTAP